MATVVGEIPTVTVVAPIAKATSIPVITMLLLWPLGFTWAQGPKAPKSYTVRTIPDLLLLLK